MVISNVSARASGHRRKFVIGVFLALVLSTMTLAVLLVSSQEPMDKDESFDGTVDHVQRDGWSICVDPDGDETSEGNCGYPVYPAENPLKVGDRVHVTAYWATVDPDERMLAYHLVRKGAAS